MSDVKPIHFCVRQTFWMEPDCYDGKTCDRMRPRWMTSYPKEGKEEDGEVLKLEIDACSMPPGSRVTIEVPVCPKCGDPADIKVDCLEKHKEWPDCDCGFSWNKWALKSSLDAHNKALVEAVWLIENDPSYTHLTSPEMDEHYNRRDAFLKSPTINSLLGQGVEK